MLIKFSSLYKAQAYGEDYFITGKLCLIINENPHINSHEIYLEVDDCLEEINANTLAYADECINCKHKGE